MGKVYIAKGGELYKFGNSENPDARIKQLQTGSPVPLSIVYTFETSRPRRAETTLKREFAAKHSHGEWFKLNEADILSVKQATTPIQAAPAAPQKPAGVATGALTALHDVWAYRWHLLAAILLALPLLLWLESRGDYTEGYVWTGATAQPVAQPLQQPVAPPTPVPTSIPIALPPVDGPAPAIVEQPHEPSDLVPIPTEQWPTIDAMLYPPTPEPTFAFPVTWPAPRPNPIQEIAATVQVQLEEAGYKPLDVPIITPQGYLGP
jgi:hypothetical protein